MLPEELLKLTQAELSPKMVELDPLTVAMRAKPLIAILSHNRYMVGDKLFTSYMEADDFLHGPKVYVWGKKDFRVCGKVFPTWEKAEEYFSSGRRHGGF